MTGIKESEFITRIQLGIIKELYKNNELYRTLYENELQKEENDENWYRTSKKRNFWNKK